MDPVKRANQPNSAELEHRLMLTAVHEIEHAVSDSYSRTSNTLRTLCPEPYFFYTLPERLNNPSLLSILSKTICTLSDVVKFFYPRRYFVSRCIIEGLAEHSSFVASGFGESEFREKLLRMPKTDRLRTSLLNYSVLSAIGTVMLRMFGLDWESSAKFSLASSIPATLAFQVYFEKFFNLPKFYGTGFEFLLKLGKEKPELAHKLIRGYGIFHHPPTVAELRACDTESYYQRVEPEITKSQNQS